MQQWLSVKGKSFLRKAGARPGQTLLDFGCRAGNYTLPAAEIAGPEGKVYALDKDPEAMDKLRQTLLEWNLDNVECLCVNENQEIPLPENSVDMLLLYDVFHGGYFPDRAQRLRLLQKIHRALKPGGLLSVYPTHLKQYGLTFKKILSEAKETGFTLQGEARRNLIHDQRFCRGRVFTLTKKQEALGGTSYLRSA